ncbi:MAG: SDR family NAD(P)-dependent oxidoreductase, partial [Cyanobacteria bacterium P01_A01_bin.17]
MQRLQDQVALVTGGSSGIGSGVAVCLAQAGAKVVVNYASSADGAEAVVDEIKGNGGDAIAIQADVSQEDQVLNLFAKTYESFGTLDILVNNAGLQKDQPLTEMTLDAWNKVISVNLTGQFLCAREAAK